MRRQKLILIGRRGGKLPRIGRVFIADSIAAMGGALLGTSTVTSYIESAAGVKAAAAPD